MACEALFKFAAYNDDGKYRDLAEEALAIMSDSALKYPLGFARWLFAAENAAGKSKQVVVMGDAGDTIYKHMLRIVRAEYRPGVVIAASSDPPPKDAPILLADRGCVNGKATAYVCEGLACKQPTTDPEILEMQLKS